MRYLCFLGLLVCLPLSAAAQSPASSNPVPADTVRLSLTETLTTVLDESPEVGQREAVEERARARHREARQNRYLTGLTFSTAHSFAPGLNIPENTTTPSSQYYLNPEITNDWTPTSLRPFTNLNIVAQQPIWTWGELSGNIKAASSAIDVEDARVDEKALEVSLRAGEVYYNVLLTEALDRLADRTGDALDRAKREIQRLLDEGSDEVGEADLFQLRLTEEEYKRRVVQVTQQMATARAALGRQLFLADDVFVTSSEKELTPLDFSLHPDSLQYYIDLGLRMRPELQQAAAGVDAREALVDVAKSDFYPKVGFQATYGFSFTLPDRPRQNNAFVGDAFRGNSTRTGFGIQLNLDYPQTRAKVEQAQAQLNEVRFQQEGARQLVRFDVEQAYRELLIAENDVASRDRDVKTSGEWLRTEQVNFDLGFGDTDNLIDAVQANLEAEARYYEAVKRYNVAVLKLLDATGTLNQRIRDGMLVEQNNG